MEPTSPCNNKKQLFYYAHNLRVLNEFILPLEPMPQLQTEHMKRRQVVITRRDEQVIEKVLPSDSGTLLLLKRDKKLRSRAYVKLVNWDYHLMYTRVTNANGKPENGGRLQNMLPIELSFMERQKMVGNRIMNHNNASKGSVQTHVVHTLLQQICYSELKTSIRQKQMGQLFHSVSREACSRSVNGNINKNGGIGKEVNANRKKATNKNVPSSNDSQNSDMASNSFINSKPESLNQKDKSHKLDLISQALSSNEKQLSPNDREEVQNDKVSNLVQEAKLSLSSTSLEVEIANILAVESCQVQNAEVIQQKADSVKKKSKQRKNNLLTEANIIQIEDNIENQNSNFQGSNANIPAIESCKALNAEVIQQKVDGVKKKSKRRKNNLLTKPDIIHIEENNNKQTNSIKITSERMKNNLLTQPNIIQIEDNIENQNPNCEVNDADIHAIGSCQVLNEEIIQQKVDVTKKTSKGRKNNVLTQSNTLQIDENTESQHSNSQISDANHLNQVESIKIQIGLQMVLRSRNRQPQVPVVTRRPLLTIRLQTAKKKLVRTTVKRMTVKKRKLEVSQTKSTSKKKHVQNSKRKLDLATEASRSILQPPVVQNINIRPKKRTLRSLSFLDSLFIGDDMDDNEERRLRYSLGLSNFSTSIDSN